MFTEENACITNSDQLPVANCFVKLNLTFGLPRVLELESSLEKYVIFRHKLVLGNVFMNWVF